MASNNELYDRVDAILKENEIYPYSKKLLTGAEFLDLAGVECGSPLHMAYIDYWDAIVMSTVLSNIEKKLKELDG